MRKRADTTRIKAVKERWLTEWKKVDSVALATAHIEPSSQGDGGEVSTEKFEEQCTAFANSIHRFQLAEVSAIHMGR